MSLEELKEKIKLAKDAVHDQEEPYKTEAFKIILSSLVSGNSGQGQGQGQRKKKKKGQSAQRTNSGISKTPLEQKNDLTELSKNCGISADELSEVITIKNNNIQIIKRPKINKNQKHVLFSLCILAGYRILYELEWVSSSQLRICLDASAVGDLKHLPNTIANESSYFTKRTEERKRIQNYRKRFRQSILYYQKVI